MPSSLARPDVADRKAAWQDIEKRVLDQAYMIKVADLGGLRGFDGKVREPDAVFLRPLLECLAEVEPPAVGQASCGAFAFFVLRFLNAVPVILLVAVLTFFLMHLLPGDPAVIIAGTDASPEAIARIRTQLGLDRPLLEQLAVWLLNLAHGNFGKSLVLNQSVLGRRARAACR